ncbi:ATP-binding protein [Mycoplasma putrefaciens]|uniref:Predicted ATPase, AAA+ superfamily n=1 Tax=Mycoplasma putrefaciens (strain ATCC 15718 / NCTC 10155 / C30 KS-1 / KS-1) TaxID=743965 RepID=A0A7U3ZSS0_MYCPK|nr:ATP-binding protein [Mycoplasma putrefaciens]AEM68876.1 Predicted ATPase, AAA+ superfamily [Mycoplasma putrefaciens KS1]
MNFKRDFYLNQLIDKKDNKKVKIITGIRRCGKSYLLFNLFYEYLLSNQVTKDQIITLSLENIDFLEHRNPLKLSEYIKSLIVDKNKKYYVMIDEIQYCEAIKNPYHENSTYQVTFIDVLLSLVKRENLDVYVTGSNSKMLSSDILTQFRGRGDEIRLNPLSFSEVCQLYTDRQQAFKQYCYFGGMPEVYSLKTEQDKKKYLTNLFNEIYIKDIAERNNISNQTEVLNILLDFISSSIGSLTNPSKLMKRFASENKINISANTIKNYLDYFEDAFIIDSSKRYDVKGGRYFSTPLKYYFTDLGLRNARINFRQDEQNHIQENIIYNELKRRGYLVDVGVVIYDNKSSDPRKEVRLEVDFVVNKADKRYYIQSALNIDSFEKKEQEIASLKKINDSFKKIVILGNDTFAKYDDNGILYISVKEFLLNENSIS